MDLSVIICTWNRSKTLPGVLASLEKCVVPPEIQWEVVIVDNNSTDDTRGVCQSFADRYPDRFRYLFEPRQGKAFALNAGLQAAQGNILALTDDDVTVHEVWISEILNMFRTFACAGIAGRVVPVWNCSQPSWIEFDGPYHHPAFGGIVRFEKGDSPFRLNCTAAGANLAFRREIVEKYGAFRTDLSGNHADLRRPSELLGGEDTEYCRRILNAGESIMYAPRAVVFHPVEQRRVEKKYLETFALNYGKYIARMDGVPQDAICYFGFPRYFFPLALKFLAKSVLSFQEKRRFFFSLEFYHVIGQMLESKRAVRERENTRQPNRVEPPPEVARIRSEESDREQSSTQ